MTWSMKAARFWWAASVSLAAGVLCGIFRGESAPVPSLTQGDLAPVPVVAVLALIPATAVLWGWQGMPVDSLAAAVRWSFPLLAAPLVVAVAAVALGSFLTGGAGSAVEATRNACGITALAILGARAAGQQGATLVPISYLLAAFLLGRPGGSPSPYPWAWVLSDGGNVMAATITACLVVLAAVAIPGMAAAAVARGEIAPG